MVTGWLRLVLTRSIPGVMLWLLRLVGLLLMRLLLRRLGFSLRAR